MADEQAGTGTAAQLPDKRILILYGSETGNSQDSAEELQRLAERLHFETDVFEMDDVRLVGLSSLCFLNCRCYLSPTFAPL
jgi:sulfite reductase alpha subunit-like flavoprotein